MAPRAFLVQGGAGPRFTGPSRPSAALGEGRRGKPRAASVLFARPRGAVVQQVQLG